MKKMYISVPMTFKTETDVQKLVRMGEQDFDARLEATSEEISRLCVKEGVQIIRLSGPTCAGKTTTADKLTATLEAAGCTVYPISIDDFFYDRDVLEDRAEDHPEGHLDYDSVNAIDLVALGKCINGLLTEGRAEIPVFDFTTGCRSSSRMLEVCRPGEKPVFLFEGIQAVYPEVVAMFDDVRHVSVFISVTRGIQVGEITFEPDEIRLMRRLVRDEAKRGADPAFTLYLWRGVRQNEVNSILPFANECDFTIDSAMPFDIHMLAPHLKKLFAEHPVRGGEAIVAAAILSKLEGIQGISERLLSSDSLYHEFILT